MHRQLRVLCSGLVLIAMIVAFGPGAAIASADEDGGRVIVTPANMQGWTCVPPGADTRPGGNASFIVDPSTPSGRGALQLTTDLTTTAKVQCAHSTNTQLANVSRLSYWTKQNSAPFAGADPAYQLATCLTGATPTACNPQQPPDAASSFTTLVFEPYQNAAEGLVTPNVWQRWDVAAGLFWSTRTVSCSVGNVVAGTPGGPATYTLAQLKAMCPQALVFQFLVNVGRNNPGYNVETDLFKFNSTVYDFEPANAGCGHGDGDFDGDNGHRGNVSFKSHCDGDVDSFDSTDRGDGKDFHSSQVSSSVVDQAAHTITMAGIGSSTGGLPVSFVLVAIPTGPATPGSVSLIFGDTFSVTGTLVTGAITIE
jgi:hypothetical protein